MLKTLRIQNVALITDLEIEFGDGLNVLTGETGAGKSIIVGSFNFILGQRLDKSLIRSGANTAKVDAVFTAHGVEIRRLADISGIEIDDNTVIFSRTLKTSGTGECRINGNIVTADVLRNCACILINIHGQHDTEVLLKPKSHVTILDNFGGQKLVRAREEYLDSLGALRGLKKQLDGFGGNDAERKRLVDMYEYQIAEIDRAKLRENEDIELADKKARMQNYEKLKNGLIQINDAFDGEGGIERKLRGVVSSLAQIGHLDTRIEKYAEIARGLKLEIDDLAGDIARYFADLEFDEDEFRRVDARLDEIKVLKRKYGATIPEIFTFRNEARANLNNLTQSEDDIAHINEKIDEVQKRIDDLAEKLITMRTATARQMETQITAHLGDLGMPKSTFRVTDIDTDGVTFLFSANAGTPPKPLSAIISGGEMSRFCLALKAVTTTIESVPTVVFDEIDTGISGIMGHKIAEKMAQIAQTSQVIAVTHLAQIASCANHHFLIEKHDHNGTTQTTVKRLDDASAKTELTRMVGGGDFIKKINP